MAHHTKLLEPDILGKVTEFGGFCLHILKKPMWAHSPPPLPSLYKIKVL